MIKCFYDKTSKANTIFIGDKYYFCYSELNETLYDFSYDYDINRYYGENTTLEYIVEKISNIYYIKKIWDMVADVEECECYIYINSIALESWKYYVIVNQNNEKLGGFNDYGGFNKLPLESNYHKSTNFYKRISLQSILQDEKLKNEDKDIINGFLQKSKQIENIKAEQIAIKCYYDQIKKENEIKEKEDIAQILLEKTQKELYNWLTTRLREIAEYFNGYFKAPLCLILNKENKFEFNIKCSINGDYTIFSQITCKHNGIEKFPLQKKDFERGIGRYLGYCINQENFLYAIDKENNE